MAQENAAPERGEPPESSERLYERALRAVAAWRRLGERLATQGGWALGPLQPAASTVRQDLQDAFAHLRGYRHLRALAGGGALAFYLLSGTYLVSPGEAAVVTRFDKIVEPRVTPGLRWHLPWPVEAARTVNVSQVRREGVGMTLPDHPAALHPPEEIQLLTGDENLLTAKAIVQYRVKEPADYLFRVDYHEDPLLRLVVKAALTEVAGRMQVDALLTSGRSEVERQARELAQVSLGAYRSGLEIVSVNLQEVTPPGDVAQAFRNVSSAAEEKSKQINDAQGYANSVIPQARGEAQRRLRDGEGYKAEVVNRARGEGRRFADVVAQYQRDAQVYGPDVTRYRLYVETMEKVLARARKYIVEPAEGGGQVNLRLLEAMPGSSTPRAAAGGP